MGHSAVEFMPCPINVVVVAPIATCCSSAQQSDAKDEAPGGISPPGALHFVREPLDSHGSRCSTVGKRTPTPHPRAPPGSWLQLAGGLQRRQCSPFGPAITNRSTSHSAPVLRIGTLVLAVLAACDSSTLHRTQVLTFRTKAWLSFAPASMPDAAWAVSGISQANPEGMATPVLASPNRHVISGLLAAPLSTLPDGILSRRFRNAHHHRF